MYRKYGRTKPPPGSVIDWSHPLSQGMLGTWLLNEANGRKAKDIVRGNDGTSNITSGLWSAGNQGTAIACDGSRFLDCGTALNVQPNDFTLAAWVYVLAASSGFKGIISHGVNTWNMALDSATHKLGIYKSGAANLALSASALTANRWHFVAATKRGNNYAVYDAGQVVGTGTSAQTFLYTEDLFIGNERNSGGTYDSKISQAYIWGRALTVQELTQLYQEPFAFIRSPCSVQYFLPQFKAGWSRPGILIGGGTI